VIILGFDGVEPKIVDTMMEAGELPNLKKLSEEGSYQRLGSSNPPQSPSAWSSFTTCKQPGNHGIYDFLLRTPSNYRPGVGFGGPTKPVLAADGSLSKPPVFDSIRKGQSFWKAANDQGIRCAILSVPFAYPAEDLTDSHQLCGLGVPDVRGTTSTFFHMSDAFTAEEKAKVGLSGGRRLPLEFENDTAKVSIPGPLDVSKQTRAYVEVPIDIAADRNAKTVTVTLPDQAHTLKEGEWSKWLEWTFEVTPQYSVRGISRIHVLEAGEQVRMYMTCVQFHPADAYIPFTTPADYGAELQERYGLFKTIGWIFDTHALRQGVLTDDVFLADVEQTMAWREQLTLDELDRDNTDLIVSAWTGTDRVSHTFWHHRDPLHPIYDEEAAKKYGRAVENTYLHMDRIVGKVMAKLKPNDLLMIMSDHGFHSFRTAFSLNTWLVRNGYASIKGQTDPATAATTDQQVYLTGFDWAKTKAYSIGFGSLFLNLQGREGKGIVASSDSAALVAELREKLLAVAHPETGEKVFTEVYTGAEIYQGVASASAPDLQLGFAEGFQMAKKSASGSVPVEVFEPVTDHWSGDHAGSDPVTTPGIFFSNQSMSNTTPNLTDLGVTALDYLNREVPADFEGVSLF
jgi:predicted AlkP superfamily phosphohydrolase/phosphomutase